VSVWQRLDDELDAWDAAGRRADLWCRDDDACRDSAALQRLLEITGHASVPVALAVIPALTESSLIDRLERAPNATILQHGYAHRNHAPPGARNWELGAHRPVVEVIAELEKGRSDLARNFGHRFTAILVPPWNRIDPEVIARLPDAGFHGLSTFGSRPTAHPVAGLVQCNTHVDLIAWRRGRAFIGVDASIERLCAHLKARREGAVDPSEATGILTHHLDLDEPAWQFLADLFARTCAHGAAEWIEGHAAFGTVTCAQSA
jgi:peptidoglycan/xylan/chitin deacetylase (PgdA/CDA1 family)